MKGEFRHFNLKAFSIDSLSEKELGLATIQNGSIFHGQDVYYSSQKNNRGLTEFTIYSFELGEIVDGYSITYLIYNKEKLISSFDVASSLHEIGKNQDGYFFKSCGKFIDENTYELLSEYGTVIDSIKKSTLKKTVIKIKPNGELEQH